jgi:hypothetical protein
MKFEDNKWDNYVEDIFMSSYGSWSFIELIRELHLHFEFNHDLLCFFMYQLFCRVSLLTSWLQKYKCSNNVKKSTILCVKCVHNWATVNEEFKALLEYVKHQLLGKTIMGLEAT